MHSLAVNTLGGPQESAANSFEDMLSSGLPLSSCRYESYTPGENAKRGHSITKDHDRKSLEILSPDCRQFVESTYVKIDSGVRLSDGAISAEHHHVRAFIANLAQRSKGEYMGKPLEEGQEGRKCRDKEQHQQERLEARQLRKREGKKRKRKPPPTHAGKPLPPLQRNDVLSESVFTLAALELLQRPCCDGHLALWGEAEIVRTARRVQRIWGGWTCASFSLLAQPSFS